MGKLDVILLGSVVHIRSSDFSFSYFLADVDSGFAISSLVCKFADDSEEYRRMERILEDSARQYIERGVYDKEQLEGQLSEMSLQSESQGEEGI